MAAHALVREPTLPVWPKQLEAVQHIRRMRGGAQAQLMRASDGCYHVVKFQSNPQHIRVLANEILASRLGQRVGLPTHHVKCIEVSDWLIQHTPELYIEIGGQRQPVSSGLHLASRFAIDPSIGEVFDFLPDSFLERVVNLADFSRALVLDKWTCNADGRQAVFTRCALEGPRYSATFIDQGYCFNAGEWNFPDLTLHGVYYRNSVYRRVTSWDSFEPALTTAEHMDIGEIWNCAASIPEEWCGNDRSALSRLVEQLHQRRSKIRDLITAFRVSSRNPFPGWVRD